MKIAIFGEGVLIKELEKSLKKNKHTCALFGFDALNRAEDLRHILKGNGYDATVFCALNFSLAFDEVDSSDLIRFKNLQYATILYGLKKLLVLTDASDIIQNEGQAQTIMPNLSPIITSLALKDKVSTVLRFFYLFGKGINRGGAAKILSAVGQKKAIAVNEDFLFSALYLADAINIITSFVDMDLPQSDYSITSGELISSVEFAKKVKSAAKKRGKNFNVDTKSARASERIFGDDNEKLLEALPKLKFTALGTAIGKTLD